MTHSELIELRDTNQLVEGQTYTVTDYGGDFDIILTANSTSTFLPVATNSNGYRIHYLLDDNSIDYMQDPTNNIEGYFDWTDNVEGTNYNIYFENSNNLFVEDCKHIHSNDNSVGNLVACEDIIIGDNNNLDLDTCTHITIQNNNILSLSSCDYCTFGNNNTLSLSNIDSVFISDNNSELVITSGENILGSRNIAIEIDGDSNFVGSDNIELEITGNCNSINNTKYFVVEGSFNSIEDSTFSNIDNSFGNEISNSNSVDITDTNNNIVISDNLSLNDNYAFLSYKNRNGVREVTNLVEEINLQSDGEGRVLKIDQGIFREIGDYDSGDRYELQNDIWTQVNPLFP